MFAARNSFLAGGGPPTFINATTSGALSVTTIGNYKIAQFFETGSFTVNSIGSGNPESATIQYLVVAGGGGGGREGVS